MDSLSAIDAIRYDTIQYIYVRSKAAEKVSVI